MRPDPRLIRRGRAHSGPFLAVVTLPLVIAGAALLRAISLARATDQLVFRGTSLSTITPLLFALLAATLVHALALGALRAAGGVLASRVKLDLHHALLSGLKTQPPRAISPFTGAMVLTDAVEGVEAFFQRYLPALLQAAAIPLVLLIYVLIKEPLSAAILAVTAPLIPLFMVLIGRWAGRLTERQWQALFALGTYFADTLKGFLTLKVFGAEGRARSRLIQLAEAHREATLGVLRVAFLSALVLELIATLSTAVVAVDVGLRLLAGSLDFATAFTVLLLAPEFYAPLRALGAEFHPAQAANDAMDRIAALLRPGTPRPEAPCAQAGPGLVFHRVGHRHDEKRGVAEVSFRVRPGELVVLTGPSGAGKTTLLELALGFLPPETGEICLNGRPPRPERFAYLPQRPHLFRGSLRDNLQIAKPDADDVELARALAAAGLAELLARLPEGLDTPIGEDGAGLSGGERQRLALARAFLHPGEAVLLDEPSAHLDPESERHLIQGLLQLKKDRPVLAVAHRPELIAAADRVLWLENGYLSERQHEREAVHG